MSDPFDDAILQSYSRAAGGEGMDLVVGEDGLTTYALPEPEVQPMSRQEMAESPEVQAMMPMVGATGRPDPEYMIGRSELPLEEQKKIFESEAMQAAGFSLGLPVSVLMTLPDLITLPPLVTAGIVTAEEGKNLEGVLNMLKYVPSAQIGEFLKDQGKNLGFTDEQVEAFGQGYLGGELSSIIVNAVPGAKQLVGGAKWLKDSAVDYAAGAPARVAERGTGTTLQSGVDPMAAVDEAIVAGQSLIPSVRGVKPGDELLVQHNLRPESLSDIEMLGGLPVPSLAIVKSSTPLKDFGSITLIGTPDMAKPSARNPVYSSDAYTRRRPNIEDQNGRPVFFNKKTWKDQTATLKNMVSAMKGGPGEESVGATAGSLRAIASKPFKSIAEVKKSRDRIVSSKDMESVKDEIDRQYIGLIRSVGEDLEDIYLSLRDSGLDTSEIMRGLIRGTLRDEDVLSRLSPDTKERVDIFREFASDLPTEYFEINPQRAVGLDEFRAALVPESLPEEQVKILERSGVQEIIKYTDEADRQKKIKSMRDVMFTIGGASVAADQSFDMAQEESLGDDNQGDLR